MFSIRCLCTKLNTFFPSRCTIFTLLVLFVRVTDSILPCYTPAVVRQSQLEIADMLRYINPGISSGYSRHCYRNANFKTMA